MMGLSLWAQIGLWAQLDSRASFELGRIQHPADWILPIAALAGIAVFVVLMYRRDAVELGRGASSLLVTLRLLAFALLFVIYLQPQWRNERDVVYNSRVLLMADTSLSMETEDGDASPSEPSRAQQVASALGDRRLLDELRKKHDVLVWRFDRDLSRLATYTKWTPEELAALAQAAPNSGDTADSDALAPTSGQLADDAQSREWLDQLTARGDETRLGEALRLLLSSERDAPLSGVVVFTDGQQNAGISPLVAAGLAAEIGVPIHPVGIGSDAQRANVRVSDFVAPARAFPGDKYAVTGYFQAQAMAGRTVTVELLSRTGSQPKAEDDPSLRLEAAEAVTLPADGEVVAQRFELSPSELGRRTLLLRVKAPGDDRNAEDNFREAVVEIVDRKTRVLLFAGAASREYQFLLNQLRRDGEMIVDVLLQTGNQGVSQNAHKLLESFPDSRESLYEYDCIVAFDPDWRELSTQQVDLLEGWVAEQAGGLVLVAGTVNTDVAVQSQSLGKVRALYPVEFNRRFAMVSDGKYGSEQPWPLEFTREGLESEFLWLGDTAPASNTAWSSFDGVYGYFNVRGPKPTAKVYAYYSDPQAAMGGQKPVYLAGQFYGSGRVFYLGSAEMWRMRGTNEAYFETFYTKLIRYVSQGRLLRGSNRGVLLTERERYMPGSTVEVHAQVNSAQLEPLELSELTVQVIGPDGNIINTALRPDATRPGSYRGQFTVRREGSYRLELPLPDSKEERLTAAPIQVTIPNLERENTRRNDPLLSEVARLSGGQYFVGLSEALGGGETQWPLLGKLRDATRTVTLTAAPDRLWDNQYMLLAICGVLCTEWLVRRLLRLA